MPGAQLAIGSDKLHNVVMHKIVVDKICVHITGYKLSMPCLSTEGISVGIGMSTAVFDLVIKLSKTSVTEWLPNVMLSVYTVKWDPLG